MSDPRRALPSMDVLLGDPRAEAWSVEHGREPVKASLRRALERLRSEPELSGDGADLIARLLSLAAEDLAFRQRPSLVRVLNGTGVVLHTNLGRAPLAEEAVAAQRRAAGYGNVELSLETGERGSRYDHCVDVVRELTGAEAALVTNNNAAAVSLVVNEFARDREVLVSRGELVEIGGSFRIPDVIERSGARLREVGTTNRTRAADYDAAVGERTGLLLRVHPSNYRVEGFAERPAVAELVEVARRAGIPLAHDIGSGLLRADLLPGFPEEPTVRASLAAGADIVSWSGDKLLGGPQCGIVAGGRERIAQLRANPLLRAFRVDKTTLAALEATLVLYRDPERAATKIPVLRMLRETAAAVAERARAHASRIALPPGASVAVVETRAVVGGGSFPGFELSSAAWRVRGLRPDAVAAAARAGTPPLLGRVEQDAFLVDLRAIVPGEEPEAARALAAAVEAAGRGGVGA